MDSPETLLSESSSAPRPVSHYSDAEVLAALRALSEAEMSRLMAFATRRMVPVSGRLSGADAQDLLNEALVKTLGGSRRWRRDIPFTQHLVACMRSIAHNWFKQAIRYTELADIPASSECMDSAIDVQADIDRLREHFERDPIMLGILDCVLDGRTAAEVQETLGISENGYRAATKRIRRQAVTVLLKKRISRQG